MKQTITKNFLLIVLLLAVVVAFAMKATVFQQSPKPPKHAPTLPADFAAYWMAGKAEVNHFRLEQAQDGSLHKGEAVLIFATEDFRTDKQVKADTGIGRDRMAPVLRTNITKKFGVGMAEHALSTSVFTPIDNPIFPNTLKVSTSAQSWDGHSYLQVNYHDNSYQVTGNSYVEKETAEDYTIGKVMLEDELWNRIRLNPDKLPTGENQFIPGTIAARLRHKRLDPLPVKLKLDVYEGVLYPGKLLKAYTIEYPTDDRTLAIIFESQFPHKIVGWEETYRSKDNLLTSRAVLTSSSQTDYRNHNAPADSTLRQALLK